MLNFAYDDENEYGDGAKCGVFTCPNTEGLKFDGYSGIYMCPKHFRKYVWQQITQTELAVPGWIKYQRRHSDRPMSQQQITNHEFNYLKRRKMHRPN